MCKLPVQIQAEFISWMTFAQIFTSCIFGSFDLQSTGGHKIPLVLLSVKKVGTGHFPLVCYFVFLPIHLPSDICMWHFGKYRCIIDADSLSINGHFRQVYIFFCCCSNSHFVGQSDTVLTLRWPEELLQFQLAELFSNSFPWLLGHVANFIQLLCFSQKMGTFCWESEVCPLYVLFILHLRSSWGRMSYITS